MSVNLSRKQLAYPSSSTRIRKTLRSPAWPPAG